MTWGMRWGTTWGGELDAFDFDALWRSRLWKQLEYAPNIKLLFGLLADAAAELDSDAVAVARSMTPDAAVSEALDDWGDRVGIRRNGMADDLYRRAIRASARKLVGEGDPSTFYDMMELFSDAGRITIVEQFPASILLWIHNLTAAEQAQFSALLRGVPGLGIGAAAIIASETGFFEWASNNASGDDGSVAVDRHWASNDGTVASSQCAGFADVDVIQ